MSTYAVLTTNESGADSLIDINNNFAKAQKKELDVLTTTILTATVSSSYQIYRGNALSNSIVYTLPLASTVTGLVFVIKKIDVSANIVLISTTGSQLIDGTLTKTLSTQYSSLTLFSNGTGWDVI